MKFVAGEITLNNASILYFSVGPDNKNSSMNIAHVLQAGIGLPERDYYFSTDAQSVAIQQAYKIFLATLFELTGSDTTAAKHSADLVYGIDKQLAASHRDNVALRDITANYNEMAVAELVQKNPISAGALYWTI